MFETIAFERIETAIILFSFEIGYTWDASCMFVSAILARESLADGCRGTV
jgi:hypothetical protein